MVGERTTTRVDRTMTSRIPVAWEMLLYGSTLTRYRVLKVIYVGYNGVILISLGGKYLLVQDHSTLS